MSGDLGVDDGIGENYYICRMSVVKRYVQTTALGAENRLYFLKIRMILYFRVIIAL